jgi:hypothetical protein
MRVVNVVFDAAVIAQVKAEPPQGVMGFRVSPKILTQSGWKVISQGLGSPALKRSVLQETPPCPAEISCYR